MPVPYLGNVTKGWSRKTSIKVETQSVIDHEVVTSEKDKEYQANFQPVPAAKVDRKPESQRTWKWWSVIVRDKTVLFKTDDIFIDAYSQRFKVQSASDWRKSGFTKYEVIEDFT